MSLQTRYSGVASLGFRERSRSSEQQSSEKHAQRLSSKLKIKAQRKHQPSGLLLSEQLRVQSLGWNQRIVDTESNVSLVQTAEAALEKITEELLEMQRISKDVDPNQDLERRRAQSHLEKHLERIDSIAQSTQYETNSLLDGSHEVQGITQGAYLEFVSATANTATSPVSGYAVRISKVASRSILTGTLPLSDSMIDAEEKITLIEGKRALRFTTIQGEGILRTLNRLNQKIRSAGLSLNASLGRNKKLSIQHQDYGSQHSFLAASSTANLLSPRAGQAVMATPGRDVQGSINQEPCVGSGQILTASGNSGQIAGLCVRYTGTEADLRLSGTGNVSVFQNALSFRVEMLTQQSMRLNVRSMKTHTLGRNIPNTSGYNSLSDVDLRSSQSLKDAQRVIQKSLNEVALSRNKLHSFNENTLNQNLQKLKQSLEQMSPMRAVIQNSEKAQSILQSTRKQMMEQAFLGSFVQSQQTPQSVMALLG